MERQDDNYATTSDSASLRTDMEQTQATLHRLEAFLTNQPGFATAAAATTATAAPTTPAAVATPTFYGPMAPLSPNLEAARPRLPEAFDPSAKGSDYTQQMELLFNRITDLTEGEKIQAYTEGLKMQIRRQVIAANYNSYRDIVRAAERYDALTRGQPETRRFTPNPLVMAAAEEEKPSSELPAVVKEVLEQYKDIMPDDLSAGVPPARTHEHEIVEEPGAKPVSRAPYRLSPTELTDMKKQIEYLLDRQLIRPSTSPYGAPVLFTPKPDSSLRMCIDYRALNKQTVKNKYPIPRIDDLLDQLRGATVVSKLDLRSGYWQIKMADNSIHKTAFRTRYGSYKYLVMPFGLCNALATFQAEMNHILRPLLDECVVVYLDDILIYSKNMKEHVEHLRKVFEILRKNKFYVKLSKSDFALKKAQFLGHMVSAEGVHVDPRKIESVKKWKVPENMKEFQQFLGFTNYFNRFVPQYAKIAAPLTDLLKKDTPFKWDTPHQQAMEQLQTALTKSHPASHRDVRIA
ncbi:unnamed protein product [Closterium sp. NIES-53]